ncbi:MAG: ComEC/Rec2 family competence protein [Candidatus Levybacteria bacterium]|nr:ComEC/Rec2 family competence protein [Candidatus Levybacteria bacterium]
MTKSAFVAILVFLLLFFTLRFYLFYRNQPQHYNGEYLSFETRILSSPQFSYNQQRISAHLDTGERIFITAPMYPQFGYGDNVRISGKLQRRVLENKKLILAMYFPKIEANKNGKNLLLAVTGFVRQKVTLFFEQNLPPISASLLLGIVFGIKENMPKDFANDLRISGVLHVVAASGMNVTMVGGFLSSIFSFFLKRQYALIASILGICFYALLAGLEPSIIRASVMGILAFLAQILGRQRLASFSLFIAAYIMLFISPSTLFDVGFQLSFMATLGLIVIRPIFDRDKKLKNLLNKSLIGEDVVTTICAQTSTLPILLANFGSYSFISIFINGLVLWTVPVLMTLGGIGGLLGIIFEPLGAIFLYLSLPLLLYFQKVVSVFSQVFGTLNFTNFSWQFTVGYYLMLISLVIFFLQRKQGKAN